MWNINIYTQKSMYMYSFDIFEVSCYCTAATSDSFLDFLRGCWEFRWDILNCFFLIKLWGKWPKWKKNYKKTPSYPAWLLKKRDREQVALGRANSLLSRQITCIQSWKYSHETVTSANSEIQVDRFRDIMLHFMKSHAKNILCPINSVLCRYSNLEMLMTTAPGQDTQKQIFVNMAGRTCPKKLRCKMTYEEVKFLQVTLCLCILLSNSYFPLWKSIRSTIPFLYNILELY